jgi:hypothetical protein
MAIGSIDMPIRRSGPPEGGVPAPSHVPLTALLITNGDAGLCINAMPELAHIGRSGRQSAVGHVRGRTQIIQFGVPSGDRLGNQVAKHIGRYRRELPR